MVVLLWVLVGAFCGRYAGSLYVFLGRLSYLVVFLERCVVIDRCVVLDVLAWWCCAWVIDRCVGAL